MNTLALRSFRHTVLVLVWAAVAVPLLILCIFQVRTDYQRQITSHERELTFETERLSFLLTQDLLQLMGDLDRIASDGSVIRSLSMPILSPISVQKIEAYLGNNPSVASVMLIDKEFFPIEVVPTWALTDDIAVYEPYMAEVVSSPQSVSEPRSRMFIPPAAMGQSQQLVFIRPILTASSSLSQPFQVDGLLLVSVNIEQLIQAVIAPPSDQALVRLLNKERVLFSLQNNHSGELYLHQSPIILGLDNQSLLIEVGQLSEGVLIEVLLAYRTQAIVVALFIVLMLLVIKKLADKLVRPLQLLSELTATMSNNNFQQRTTSPLDASAMHYREFSEAFQLLGDMETLISKQFQQLHEANATLEQKVAERTEALENNIQLLGQQRKALQLLVQYSVKVHQLNTQNELAQQSVPLATHIARQPCGLYLLRNEFFAGCEYWGDLSQSVQAFLQQHHRQLHDFASLSELMHSRSDLHCFPVGSSVSSYQGFFITARSASSEEAGEALMVLTTMLSSAIRQYNLTAKLRQLAHSDAVTGLPNRHFFSARYKDKLEHFNAAELANHFGVFVIDVNGLKFVNDHYGHQHGDAMLTLVADALRYTARANDVVARVGGDEFYVLLDNVTSDMCLVFSERLREVSGNLSMVIDAQTVAVSFSFGFACTDNDSLKNLLVLADERMYFAKKKHYQGLTPADA